MAFSPDSRLAVSTGDDGLVIVWDAATGRPVERLVGHAGRVEGAAFSPDGRTLYTASLDGTVLQWDIGGARRFGDPFPAGQSALTGGARSGSAQLAPATALSPDGHTLAIRSGSSGVRLISTRTLSRTGSFSTGAGTAVGALAWAGRRVATGQADGTVTVWSSSGMRVASLRGLHHMVRGVATAEGGRLVAAVDGTTTNFTEENGRLAIWNRGRLVGGAPINLHTFGNAVVFSPDGSLLAVATDATDRPSVLIVDPKSGRVLRRMRPLTGAISLAFSPDGTLASGSWEGIVNLWDPRTGARIGHASLAAAAPVASIAFDPTGRRYAIAGGSSGLTRLWDTTTEQQIGSDFPGGQGQWGTVAFTPDGRYLLVVYGDGTAYRWPISVGAWEQHACAVAGRNMTHEEWQRYVGSRPYVRTCPQYPPGA
jgi:WD40 repeat protein